MIGLARERYTKNLWSQRAEGERPLLVNCEDEDDQAEYVIRRDPGAPRGGHRPAAAGRAVPRVAPQHVAGSRAGPRATSPSTSTAG